MSNSCFFMIILAFFIFVFVVDFVVVAFDVVVFCGVTFPKETKTASVGILASRLPRREGSDGSPKDLQLLPPFTCTFLHFITLASKALARNRIGLTRFEAAAMLCELEIWISLAPPPQF